MLSGVIAVLTSNPTRVMNIFQHMLTQRVPIHAIVFVSVITMEEKCSDLHICQKNFHLSVQQSNLI